MLEIGKLFKLKIKKVKPKRKVVVVEEKINDFKVLYFTFKIYIFFKYLSLISDKNKCANLKK